MALILNIETSSESCSVAIASNGIVRASLQSDESRSHASILTVLIERLLRENNYTTGDFDAVAISKGPGSYTGLRIGVSVAKGICYGAQKPLIAVNTLQSMMNGLKRELTGFDQLFPHNTLFYPMLDARRQEVYLAGFLKNGEIFSETAAEIITEDSFSDLLKTQKLVFFGSGADKIKTTLKNENALFVEGFILKAAYLTELSEVAFRNKDFVDVAYFEPLYLKDFIATIPKRKVL
jgi:tRNA threonylcarbamoyladenosine biosynthesis protein TsaB